MNDEFYMNFIFHEHCSMERLASRMLDYRFLNKETRKLLLILCLNCLSSYPFGIIAVTMAMKNIETSVITRVDSMEVFGAL